MNVKISLAVAAAFLHLLTLYGVSAQEQSTATLPTVAGEGEANNAEEEKGDTPRIIEPKEVLCRSNSDVACKCDYADCRRKLCIWEIDNQKCICRLHSCSYRVKTETEDVRSPFDISAGVVISPALATSVFLVMSVLVSVCL